MEEQILIKELKNRNRTVFDHLFITYYSGLCAFANKFLNNRELAEDVVQDFFVSFWIEGSRLKIEISLKAYLFTSIRNRCLDWQKHLNSTEKYRKFVLSGITESGPDEEEMVTESELRVAVYNALQKCSPRSREIFTLSRIDGLSNQQIADRLGLSKRTVELQISNALKTLRDELSGLLPVWVISWLLI